MNQMKTRFTSIALFLAMLWAAQARTIAAPRPDSTQVKVRVDGLSCPFCAYGLEKKLKSIDGVEKLTIKVNDGLAILQYREAATIDTVIISKKVRQAGFTPRGIEITREPGARAVPPTARKITLHVDEMTCEGCAARVAGALEAIECARQVHVDLKTAQATLLCTNPQFDEAKFVKAIESRGFKARLEKK